MSLPDLHLHDRAIPGPLGFAAFAAVKFAGYLLAGLVLRKLYPSVTAALAKMAAVRTGLGILLGPVFFIGVAALANHVGWTSESDLMPYLLLFAIRVLIWALVIWIFIRKTREARKYLWVNAGV